MAIIGYMRVSDDEQNEDLQIDALQAAGCNKIYGDHGVSGKRVHREELSVVLEGLQKGDTFVVWKFDRLGRSAVFLLLLADEFRQKGIRFMSTTEGYAASTFEGRLNYGIRALFAEHESEMISQRTKAGMAAAKRRGVHVGRPRKLSRAQVEEIRTTLAELPKLDHERLASQYCVSRRTLTRVINGKSAYRREAGALYG